MTETARSRPDSAEGLNKNHDAYFVPGLHRGLLVMEAIAREQRPLSVSEIASKVELTRSSVFRLAYTLRHMGFLEPTPDGKAYGLGPRVLNIGFAYLASKDIIELSRPDLEQLRDETSVSSHLAIRDERDVLFLSCVQTRSGFLSNINVGTRLPAHATPMGWLLLSELPSREIAELYRNADFEPLSEQSPRSIEELLQRIAAATAKRHVVSRGIVEHGGSSVTAPVFDKSGHVIAAIDISGPDSAFDLDLLDTRYVDAVVQTASQISRRLGYLAPARP